MDDRPPFLTANPQRCYTHFEPGCNDAEGYRIKSGVGFRPKPCRPEGMEVAPTSAMIIECVIRAIETGSQRLEAKMVIRRVWWLKYY